MTARHLDIVRKHLQEYADRGVFGGLAVSPPRNGKVEFLFTWRFYRRYTLIVDLKAGSLKVKDFLPNIPGRSALYADLKRFIEARASRDLPPYQRIDTRRVEPALSVRSGNVSVTFKVKNNQYAYATKRIVNLIHQIHNYLSVYHLEYLVENLDFPEE